MAGDPIATAKELQTDLATRDADGQLEFATYAIDALGDPRELYDSKTLLIHALGAHILKGAVTLSADEEIYHGTYIGDSFLKSDFSRFAFVSSKVIHSLCLMLVDTEVLLSKTNPEFVGEHIRSGVYVPVHAVESALAA